MLHYRYSQTTPTISDTLAFISPQRPGKRLLVLDLDYTLFDMTDTSCLSAN